LTLLVIFQFFSIATKVRFIYRLIELSAVREARIWEFEDEGGARVCEIDSRWKWRLFSVSYRRVYIRSLLNFTADRESRPDISD